jgi:glucokinase
VIDGKSKLTNLPWLLDSKAMSQEMKIPVCFINDLEATAYGMAGLEENELATLAEGIPGRRAISPSSRPAPG